MSISLTISWADGRFEQIPVAGQLSASTSWRDLGLELGLKWLPLFHAWIPVEPENLDALISEVERFRDAASKRGDKWKSITESADRLTTALRDLKDKSGWEASIG